MRKEAKLLASKAVNSLTLSVEFFNRPFDQGRIEGVLIMLDHAFEMLLKASILHRGGVIREQNAKNTIGFEACIRKGLSNGKIKFLNDEQVLALQAINSLRDAAQHHLLDISEQHLYMHAQAGLTLFRDLYRNVFERDLRLDLPERVLPLSTKPPCDLEALFDREVDSIRQLLRPGRRRQIEAVTKLRALAILDKSLQGETVQPSDRELRQLGGAIVSGRDWKEVFPGVAQVEMTATGYGPALDLRITKRDNAVPVHLVAEGTPNAAVIAVKRVDDQGFYNLGGKELAGKVKLSVPKTTAIIWYLKMREDPECYKLMKVGTTEFHRYSQRAIVKIQEALKQLSSDDIWKNYQKRKNIEK
jgi:hypothetical protein